MKPDLPMTATRRDWIRAAGAAALALSAPGLLTAGPQIDPVVVPPAANALDLLDMSVATTMIGHQFEMMSSEGQAICELIAVGTAGCRSRAGKAQKSFSMELRPITSQGNLVQDIYQVHHPVLGTFDLLLVPHTNARGARVLLATFSRL